jgi:hypothetical protein
VLRGEWRAEALALHAMEDVDRTDLWSLATPSQREERRPADRAFTRESKVHMHLGFKQ